MFKLVIESRYNLDYNLYCSLGDSSVSDGFANFIDDAPLGGNEYYTNESVTGTLKILRLDENIISGTFDIRLQDPITNKIIHLTDGRFDIKR